MRLETADISLSTYAELLGKKLIKGQVIDNVNDVAPYVALLYRLPKTMGKIVFIATTKRSLKFLKMNTRQLKTNRLSNQLKLNAKRSNVQMETGDIV